MTWSKKYRIPFQSKNETQYMVYIWEQNYAGEVTTLTGAAEPFVTQENDNDDIFTPVRGQTGTLRIIDTTNDSSLLETLIPANNTEKLVTLVTGTWSGSSFTDNVTQWQGFLCAEAFTQPWDNQKKIIEFPLKSLLAALEDVQIPVSKASLETNIAKLIRYAFEALSIGPSEVRFVGNTYIGISQGTMVFEQFFLYILKWSLFFNEDEVMDQGDSTIELIGSSYLEAISIVARMYGLTFRETGSAVTICMYDWNPLYIEYYSWNDLIALSEGNMIGCHPTPLPSADLLSTFTFKGKNNVSGFLQGRRSVQVTLAIGGISLNVRLPHTTEDNSSIVDVPNMYNGHLYVQPHPTRTLGYETFSFGLYHLTRVYISQNLYNLFYSADGASNYAACVSQSVLFLLNYDENNFVTGAFPCRWMRKEPTDHSATVLQNGLFLCTQTPTVTALPTNYPYDNPSFNGNPVIYSLQSLLQFHWNSGFVNINFNLHSLIVINNKVNYQIDQEANYIIDLYLYCELLVGSHYWNGNSWTETESHFTINCKNGKIQTNKTESINVSATEGWFIPISEPLSGFVTFKILSVVMSRPYNSYDHIDARCHIMSDLKISYYQNNDLAASDRSENTYRESIEISGFSNAEKTTLQLGTINNNIYAPCFIQDSDNNYVEIFQYNGQSAPISQRPELNLLERMKQQYRYIRHTFVGEVETGIGIHLKKFTHNNKNFFGIDKQHNWRDETQEVKFIEVT